MSEQRRRYFVKTWDWDLHRWTHQKGVRVGPYSLFGLRAALRKLRALGYDACKGDNSTWVYAAGEQKP